MALQLSEDRISLTERRNQIIDGLHELPSQIKQVLATDKSLQALARGTLSVSKSLLIMGRGFQYVTPVHQKNCVANLYLVQIRHLPRRCTQN